VSDRGRSVLLVVCLAGTALLLSFALLGERSCGEWFGYTPLTSTKVVVPACPAPT